MDKTPEQRILELEQELIFYKKQQAKLEHELKQTNKKVVLFTIRKKSDPELLRRMYEKIKKA